MTSITAQNPRRPYSHRAVKLHSRKIGGGLWEVRDLAQGDPRRGLYLGMVARCEGGWMASSKSGTFQVRVAYRNDAVHALVSYARMAVDSHKQERFAKSVRARWTAAIPNALPPVQAALALSFVEVYEPAQDARWWLLRRESLDSDPWGGFKRSLGSEGRAAFLNHLSGGGGVAGPVRAVQRGRGVAWERWSLGALEWIPLRAH